MTKRKPRKRTEPDEAVAATELDQLTPPAPDLEPDYFADPDTYAAVYDTKLERFVSGRVTPAEALEHADALNDDDEHGGRYEAVPVL